MVKGSIQQQELMILTPRYRDLDSMRQKINKDIKDSNSDPEQVNLIFIELSTSNTQKIHSCQYHITPTHKFK